jgi:hypothetical protein
LTESLAGDLTFADSMLFEADRLLPCQKLFLLQINVSIILGPGSPKS